MSAPESEGAATPRKAIWLASYPKSGNTWARVFLYNLMREMRGEPWGRPSEPALAETAPYEYKEWWATVESTPSLGDLSSAEIYAARFKFQGDLVSSLIDVRATTEPVLLKTHSAVTHLEGFSTINFDVSQAAVYTVRNPLDVCIDYAKHSGSSLDETIAVMASAYAGTGGVWPSYELMGSWSLHVASWLLVRQRPVLILRYEDMLAAPEVSFARVAAFLGFKPSAEQVLLAVEKSSLPDLTREEEPFGFVDCLPEHDRFFRNGKAGQWREVLSQEQINAIVAAHGPMMMRCGYLPEDCSTWGQGVTSGEISSPGPSTFSNDQRGHAST